MTFDTSDELRTVLKKEFARLPVVRGTAGVEEEGVWTPQITPPLPGEWPPHADGPLTYYAYATRTGPPIVDGQEVSAPWGRIEQKSTGRLRFQPLLPEVRSLGVQGVWPLGSYEIELVDEVKAAGGWQNLLRLAASNPSAALLLRRRYCLWLSGNTTIAGAIQPYHRSLFATLDCASLPKPAPPPAIDVLLYPEFNRIWPPGPSRTRRLGHTPHPFPEAWPVGSRTALVYYGFAYRVAENAPIPKPRTVWAPWGTLVRDGPLGRFRFVELTTTPVELGIEPGRKPSNDWLDLAGRVGAADQAEETLVRAASDPEAADLIRRYYGSWRSGEQLLASVVFPRHMAFAEFLALNG